MFYVFKYDLVFFVLCCVNGGYWFGDVNGDIVQFVGFDMVDVLCIEIDMLGYFYFGDVLQVLGDLYGFVCFGWKLGERCGVLEIELIGKGEVWEVQLEGCLVEQVCVVGDLMCLYGNGVCREVEFFLDNVFGDEFDFWLGVMVIVDWQLVKQQSDYFVGKLF